MHPRGHARRVGIPVQQIEGEGVLAHQVVVDYERPDQIVRPQQVEGARHPFGEVRQHLVGRGSLAVHETVREPPRPGAQRLEQQGDRHRRSDRQRRTAPPADERPDPDDHADVHDRDPGRKP